jgi:hypothetical protein
MIEGIVESEERLHEVVELMKSAAALTPDDPLDGYTKTVKEARNYSRNLSPQLLMDVLKARNCASIIYKERWYSIVLTRDEHHKQTWHFSISMPTVFEGVGTSATDEEAVDLLKVFFSSWKEIPNPGKMKHVRHFVGND